MVVRKGAALRSDQTLSRRLFSPIFGRIDPRQIVEWILADKLDVRFQLQMHKFIWSPAQRAV